MKKVIVISTSLRPGSNSHALAEQFAKGAEAAGHQVELVSLRGKEIKFCIGCLSCQKTGACVIKDDVPAIMESVLNADVVCWATPIYYYEMSGQMKTLIDRMNAMYPKDYKFRDIYLLTTAAENEEFVPKRAKPYIMPMPVLMLSAYEVENEKPCAMLAVWGGISNEKELTITVASERHTLKGILARQAFVVSMGTVETATECDYLGITKGDKVADKFEKSGFHTTKSEFVDAPLIDELPFAVECRAKSYDPETWRLVGEIVNVSLDESILGENGKVSFDKFHPLAFDWMNEIYLSLSEKVGNAYRDGLALR